MANTPTAPTSSRQPSTHCAECDRVIPRGSAKVGVKDGWICAECAYKRERADHG